MNEIQNIYGGIEGGATHSHIILLNGDGKLLAEAEIPLGTNHWQIGLSECAKRINDLTNIAKQTIGLNVDVPLHSLGLTLSGADSQESIINIEQNLVQLYPNLSKNYFVCCDTVGSIETASNNGGIILISGTGSNCLLLNPDGSRNTVGGWGHMMGDEGSAYWISHRCVKKIFDSMDNFVVSQFDISVAKKIMFEYFKVSDQMGMLDHLYTNFSKAHFSGLCLHLSKAAVSGDEFLRSIFFDAGIALANHILAQLTVTSSELYNGENGLKIICTGSVWNSWPLLKQGFLETLSSNKCGLYKIQLLRLEKPSSFGAAKLGATKCGHKLNLDYSTMTSIILEHSF